MPEDLRADANLHHYITSVMQNAASGAGTAADPSSAWYVGPVTPMDPSALGRLWTKNAFAAKIAKNPAVKIAQAGLVVTTGDDDPDCSHLDAQYGLTTALGEAHQWSRVMGGAGVIVDVAGDDFATPWHPQQGQRIRLRVGYSPLLLPVSVQSAYDPAAPFGFRFYTLAAGAWSPGIAGNIHWSRVLPMVGHPVPDGVGIATLGGWPGVSIFDLIWSQLAGEEATAGGARRIADRFALWILKLDDLAAKQSGPEAALLADIIRDLSASFRNSGMFPVPAGCDLSAVSLPLAGLDKLEEISNRRLAGASEIPAFELWGDSASGFSNDDAAVDSLRNTLRAMFDTSWRENATRFLRNAAVVATGTAPKTLTVEPGGWLAPISIEAEKTVGAVETSVRDLSQAGIITRDEGRNRLAAEGWDLDEAVAVEQPATTVETPASTHADAATGTLFALEVEPLTTLLSQVRTILPDLAPELWPHMTILNLGATRRGDQAAIRDEAHVQAKGWPATLQPDAIGPLGDDGALVLFLRSAGLRGAQNRTLRAMAPYVQAQQHPRFLPHVTLGRLGRPLTDEEQRRLDTLDLPAVDVRAVVLREGDGTRIRWAVT